MFSTLARYSISNSCVLSNPITVLRSILALKTHANTRRHTKNDQRIRKAPWHQSIRFKAKEPLTHTFPHQTVPRLIVIVPVPLPAVFSRGIVRHQPSTTPFIVQRKHAVRMLRNSADRRTANERTNVVSLRRPPLSPVDMVHVHYHVYNMFCICITCACDLCKHSHETTVRKTRRNVCTNMC